MLVTGAAGFVGGHVARYLAGTGVTVRGTTRRPPRCEPGDPPIEWRIGDLRDSAFRRRCLEGVRGVIHVAGWVGLGRDRRGEAHAINVDVTRFLLDEARACGVERFVHTSTLWTVAAGTAERPADEDSPWNLAAVRCPYSDTKREAERLVRCASSKDFGTVVLCPGLVVGPRDPRPTSTRVFLDMSRRATLRLPDGGIPLIDARVLAHAHVAALETGGTGLRYIVAGPYRSYREMAALVARLTGRPRRIRHIGDGWEKRLRRLAGLIDRTGLDRKGDVSAAAVSGGFLRLHVSGARADRAFDLRHPPAERSIGEALEDHRRSGRASWLAPIAPGVLVGPETSG